MLTKSDLDEIGDKVRDVATKLLQKLEQQYIQTMGGVQEDLQQFQLQETKIQEDVRKVSSVARSSAQGQSIGTEIIPWPSMDLWFFPFPTSLVCADNEEQHTFLDRVPNISLNLSIMQMESLHALL